MRHTRKRASARPLVTQLPSVRQREFLITLASAASITVNGRGDRSTSDGPACRWCATSRIGRPLSGRRRRVRSATAKRCARSGLRCRERTSLSNLCTRRSWQSGLNTGAMLYVRLQFRALFDPARSDANDALRSAHVTNRSFPRPETPFPTAAQQRNSVGHLPLAVRTQAPGLPSRKQRKAGSLGDSATAAGERYFAGQRPRSR